MYQVVEANFIAAAKRADALPETGLLEACFIGRSNSGKSSLINAICGQKALARTSSTPGRTREINFFKVRIKNSESKEIVEASFVDLPGYGYAKVSRAEKTAWADLLESYLHRRPMLSAAILLIDCRRDPEEEEKYIAGLSPKLTVALTKTDKLPRNAIKPRIDAMKSALGLPRERLIAVSTLSGKRCGLDELMQCIAADMLESRG